MLLPDHIELLKVFVGIARNNPSVLHDPELNFYKDYLESLGAQIPSATEKKTSQTAPPSSEPAEATSEFKVEDLQEEEPEIPFPELDNSGVIPEDNEEPLPMGDSDKTVTDEELEQAGEKRDLASSNFNEGNYEEALKYYTAAIELNPESSLLHAKRASVLIKLSKPLAAIRDCDKAILINPDSATGYKFRGRANRLLGKWAEAHNDLALACKIDYDDVAAEWLKEVEPNAKKLSEYNRAKERQTEEKELCERRERVKRAQEANKRATEQAKTADGGFDSASNLSSLFNDPEILKLIQEDPSLLKKISDIMQNPGNFMKYMSDPAVMKLMQKITSKPGGGFPFGGGFGAGANAGGSSFSGFGGPESFDDADLPPFDLPNFDNASKPKKAPEPDLD